MADLACTSTAHRHILLRRIGPTPLLAARADHRTDVPVVPGPFHPRPQMATDGLLPRPKFPPTVILETPTLAG
jgi:hypothetical protein